VKIPNVDNSFKPVGSAAGSSGGARPGKNTTAAASSGDADSVQLSPLASQMQAIEAGMANTPVVDVAHVAAIRQAIADGLFKVNPDVVADHLLATARELLQSQQP
jgi:negative regulator of flagellin synthesis FlgM